MIDFSIGKVAAAYASNRSTVPGAPIPAPVREAGSTLGAGLGTDAGIGVSGASDAGFGAFIDQQVTRAVDTVQRSERVSLAAIAGKASTQEVVQSVIAAEMTIQTVVAIRDKMVQAYQDIMRMPI
jgi:flagellar hook-basal body complex protein FliE